MLNSPFYYNLYSSPDLGAYFSPHRRMIALASFSLISLCRGTVSVWIPSVYTSCSPPCLRKYQIFLLNILIRSILFISFPPYTYIIRLKYAFVNLFFKLFPIFFRFWWSENGYTSPFLDSKLQPNCIKLQPNWNQLQETRNKTKKPPRSCWLQCSGAVC